MADKIIEKQSGIRYGTDRYGVYFQPSGLWRRILHDGYPGKTSQRFEDRIPVMVSERLIDITQDYVGEYVEIHGQFRSYNRHEEKRNRLVLSVFAREVKFVGRTKKLCRSIRSFWTDISVNRLYTENTVGKRDRRSSDGSQSTLRKIRLHTMYMLGKKCQICFCF